MTVTHEPPAKPFTTAEAAASKPHCIRYKIADKRGEIVSAWTIAYATRGQAQSDLREVVGAIHNASGVRKQQIFAPIVQLTRCPCPAVLMKYPLSALSMTVEPLRMERPYVPLANRRPNRDGTIAIAHPPAPSDAGGSPPVPVDEGSRVASRPRKRSSGNSVRGSAKKRTSRVPRRGDSGPSSEEQAVAIVEVLEERHIEGAADGGIGGRHSEPAGGPDIVTLEERVSQMERNQAALMAGVARILAHLEQKP